MNKGFWINKKEEEQKSLVNDIEFTHKTKNAIILARQGKFLESEKIYKELISKGKFTHLTYHRLSGLYERLGRRKDSLNCLQKSVNLKKNYAEGYSDIGKYFLDTGDLKNALKYSEIALQHNQNLIGPYINIGII